MGKDKDEAAEVRSGVGENIRGTSAFSHQDDAVAPLHTTHADHFDALYKGGDVPDKPLESIVLGPGAYGSPDPETLGRVQLMGVETDEETGEMQAVSPGEENADEDVESDELPGDLNEWTKAQLQEYADSHGIDYESGGTKAELIQAIEDSESEETS